MIRGFVSDNCSAAHPKILEAIAAENGRGHAPSYGADEACARAVDAFGAALGKRFPVSFVFNGTGANVLSLACCLRPFESVVCADCAHIAVDETGAPERVLGSKLQLLPTPDGKLTPDQIVPLLLALGNPHHSQPRVLSLTNVTEWGAVYTPDEVRLLCDFAHANELLVHMDGARIGNAAVAAGASLAEMTWQAGLDILSFGGCKNGLMFGEAVVFFNRGLAKHSEFLRKNVTQLDSKMRFIGAQYEALLTDGLWQENAAHANAMAQKLQVVLEASGRVEIVHGAQANMIFAKFPPKLAAAICAEGFGSPLGGMVRMVTSWDTQQEEIDALAALLNA